MKRAKGTRAQQAALASAATSAAVVTQQATKRSADEVLREIVAAMESTEHAIAVVDAKLGDAERTYVESITPMLTRRAELAVELQRSHVARVLLADMASGHDPALDMLPRDAARLRVGEAEIALAAAREELAANPEPQSYSRMETVLDPAKWKQQAAYEHARDEVWRLEAVLHAAEKAALFPEVGQAVGATGTRGRTINTVAVEIREPNMRSGGGI